MSKETKRSSLERYHLKQILKQLERKRSPNNSTSLITLYIPPKTQLSEFANLLRNEYGTASNIKDKKTGKAVMDAIQSILARMPTYTNSENGLVIFAGITDDKGKMENYAIHPPEPVGVKTYRCESYFDVGHLKDMLDHKDTIGVLAIDRGGATFAIIRGNELKIIEDRDSFVPSKHGRGGQSAQRIERGIEIMAQEFYGKMAVLANKIFLEEYDVRFILVGGPAMSKDQFLEHKVLDYRLKEKIYKVYDIGYTGEPGIREILDKAKEDIGEIELIREKKLMDEFAKRLAKDSGKVTYGEDAVRKALQMAAVETVLFSEEVEKRFYYIECKNCGKKGRESVEHEDIIDFPYKLRNLKCPECGKEGTFEITSEIDLIDEFEEMANATGAEIEVIGVGHEMGAMLAKSFTGIAALLRYNVDL